MGAPELSKHGMRRAGRRDQGGWTWEHRSSRGVSTGCAAPVGGSREVGAPSTGAMEEGVPECAALVGGSWEVGAPSTGAMEDRSREVGAASTGPRQPRARAPYREHRTRMGPRASEAAKHGERERNATAEHGEERRRQRPRAGSGSRRTERIGRGSERALGLGFHLHGDDFAQTK